MEKEKKIVSNFILLLLVLYDFSAVASAKTYQVAVRTFCLTAFL